MAAAEFTFDDFERSLTNHAPDAGQIERIELLRDGVKLMGEGFFLFAPDSRERSIALQHLEDAVMWAVKSIVLEQPAVEGAEPEPEPEPEYDFDCDYCGGPCLDEGSDAPGSPETPSEDPSLTDAEKLFIDVVDDHLGFLLTLLGIAEDSPFDQNGPLGPRVFGDG